MVHLESTQYPGEKKWFYEFMHKVEHLEPDPGQISVKKIMQTRQLNERNIEGY